MEPASEPNKEGVAQSPNQKGRQSVISKNIWLLVVGILMGTFSIFAASSFRDVVDSVFQIVVPLSERAVQGGTLLMTYRIFYFLIIMAILVSISIVLVLVNRNMS